MTPAGEPAAQLLRQAEPDHCQHFIESFEDAGRDAWRHLFQPARQIADQPPGLLCVVQFPLRDISGRPTSIRTMPSYLRTRFVSHARCLQHASSIKYDKPERS